MTLSPSVAKVLKEESEQELRDRQARLQEEEERKNLQEEEERKKQEENNISEEIGEAPKQQEALTTESEKLIRKVQKFGQQVVFSDDNMQVKKKKGTDYKITSSSRGSLFPYISSEKNFMEFLVFLNACLKMKASEKLPSAYFSTDIITYLSTNDEDAQDLRLELENICDEARDFAQKRYSGRDINGYDATRIAFEKIYAKRFLTSKARKTQANAFNKFLRFLETGEEPRKELESTFKDLERMASTIINAPKDMETQRAAFEERLSSKYYAGELRTTIKQKSKSYFGKPSDEIKEYMESLPEDLRKEILELYEAEVIPRIEEEIKAAKEGKRGALREATTARRQEEIERLQDEIDAKEAKLKNLGRNESKELEQKISRAKNNLEAWREKNFKRDAQGKLIRDEKIISAFQRQQGRVEKIIRDTNAQLATLSRQAFEKKKALEEAIGRDRKKLTDMKIKMSARKRKASSKQELGSSLLELKDMLNPEYYNDEHIRLLRGKFLEQFVEESLGSFLEEKREQFDKQEDNWKKWVGKYSKVGDQIKELKKEIPTVQEVAKEVERLANQRRDSGSLREPYRSNLSLGRKTISSFISAGYEVKDIVKNTKRLIEQYDSMDEYVDESISDMVSQLNMDIQETQEDIEEELDESFKKRQRLKESIRRDVGHLDRKMEKLRENLKAYKPSDSSGTGDE